MSTRRGESLAARVATTQQRHEPPPEPRPPAAPASGAPSPDAPPPTRHCWYDGPHGRQAALLLEWRRVGGGWAGRVAVAAPDPGGWALVEMWVDAGLLAAVAPAG